MTTTRALVARCALCALGILGTLGSATAARAELAPSAALAVMPFQNLNQDASIDWLRRGIPETMVADLRDAKRAVVERDQLDRALAEIALQGDKLSDESRAARAGRLVGAAAVVVGGYQRAGSELRITARLVTVETGVVEQTAKVTGPLERVFALQDQVVAQLLKLPSVKARPKPKEPKKTLQAYEAYAKSLQTASDADKLDELRRALDLDPDFHYALYDLRALESRLNRLLKRSNQVIDERTQALLATFDNEAATPYDRHMAGIQAMSALMTQFRYQALLDVATRIETTKLPELPPSAPGVKIDAREFAGFAVFQSLTALKRGDLALQVGERFLQRYPGGAYTNGVDLQMRAAIEQRHRHDESVKRAAKELEELAFEERDRERSGKLSAQLARSYAFRRCSILTSGERWAEAVDACREFITAYRDGDDGDDLVKLAWMLSGRALAEQGRFDEANDEALRLLDAHPGWAREHSVEMIRRTWPQP